MVIIPEKISFNSSLLLRAYSFKEDEFIPLERIIRIATNELRMFILPPDNEERSGRGYEIRSHLVVQFQEYLGVIFGDTGFALKEQGTQYSCKELKVKGGSSDCKTIYAEDIDRAITKCALVAKDKGWYSGEAKEGSCPKKPGSW
ncbi:MAG: hypothetical protein WDO15_01410 [Bacteroidota bacterium]